MPTKLLRMSAMFMSSRSAGAAVRGECFRAASRPCATAATVRSSPPETQSPPAQTLASEVRPSASTLIAAGLEFDRRRRCRSAPSATKVWPIALNTWSAASVAVSPVPTSLPSCSAVYSSSIAGHLAVLDDDALRLQPVADRDAVGRREILLEVRGVHVLLAAPVADRHLLGAEQLGLHGGVDRRHAAADDDDAAADRQR